MNARMDQLIDEALALAPDERSAVVLVLLDSLEGLSCDSESIVTKAWADEIAQRKVEQRTGAVQAVPWSEARARLLAL